MAVRVLLCGMGGYGENYVKEYLSRDVLGSTLVAIADPFAEKSPLYQSVVEKGIPLYSSPEEFFASNKVDLTIISSPIHTHFPYVMLALENGSHVLTEKPVCFDEAQIDAMEAKSRETGLFVAVGYQLCFSRDVIAMKKDILSGVYGAPKRFRTLRLMRRNDIYYARSNWAGALLCHGEKVFDSPFTNACAHQYQNMVFLLGKTMEESATSVEASGALIRIRPTITNCDTAALKFKTADGVELYYYSSHAVDEAKVGPWSTYEFEKGYIEEVAEGFIGHTADGRTIDYTTMDKGERLEKLWEAVRCVEEGRTPICTLKTAREHTHAVLLAQEKGVLDWSGKAEARKDDKDSTYYTVTGLSEALQKAYGNWSVELNLI
ncbi:MAG: Gfo/Idh/MocA family oxidoreductase [Spirochaetales bacterium]|nr:Gfo/Idh/MocA family oxidoreductase [Candidatus Physcosoma equi]